MGKRFYLGVGILIAFLALGLGTSFLMAQMHQSAAQALEEASALALSGQMEQAVSLAEDAYQQWDRHWKFTASVADHAPMDDVDQLFAEMTVYAQAEEREHFAACCAQLSQLVTGMSNAHCLAWWNFI